VRRGFCCWLCRKGSRSLSRTCDLYIGLKYKIDKHEGNLKCVVQSVEDCFSCVI
jgi:hypothetical protein